MVNPVATSKQVRPGCLDSQVLARLADLDPSAVLDELDIEHGAHRGLGAQGPREKVPQ